MEEQRTPSYWALKTTEGRDGHDCWDRFFGEGVEGVIAIGWHLITVSPAMVSKEQLISSIKEAYPKDDAKYGARKIKQFIEIAEEDRVLICRGYAPNQRKDVYIYGFATVTGPFYDDMGSKCWRFRHPAKIYCRVERCVPIDMLRRTLNKKAMLQTLHKIDNKEGFHQLELQLCKHQR